MSAETSVVIALFFVGFLMVAATVYSSIDYYQKQVKNAQYDQDTMKKARMQTDITIINVTKDTTKDILNLTIKNTGRTTLNSSLLNVFVEGIPYPYNFSRNTLVPENITNITIYSLPANSNYQNYRIKVVSENGISEYALAP